MTKGTQIIDGISEWIREQVGPDAKNRGDDNSDADDTSVDSEADDDESSSEYDSPACCSASGNSDVTVLDP